MNSNTKHALRVIVLFGIVSLFGDIIYEGARSITGPYLAFLGAGAAVVGLVGGLGEFFGYGLRVVFGYVADRTRAYWPLTVAGYLMILAIPLLALTGRWEVAAALIILERTGKAIRTPARDTILSYAAKNVGRGLGFGLHEMLDQVGAVIGPLIIAGVLLAHKDMRLGFAFLGIPAFFLVVSLVFAGKTVGKPEKMESDDGPAGGVMPAVFYGYGAFIFLALCGCAHFQLISFHAAKHGILPYAQIPLVYVAAMAVDGLFAPVVGRVYDKAGLKVLAVAPVLTAALPFLVFAGSAGAVVAGIVLWGIVMSVHETVLRAAVADLTPSGKRATAYGAFNLLYGAGWFVGTTVVGVLYQKLPRLIVPWVIVMEAAALGVLVVIARRRSMSSPRIAGGDPAVCQSTGSPTKTFGDDEKRQIASSLENTSRNDESK